MDVAADSGARAQTPLTLLALRAVPRHRAGCCTARRSASRVRMVGENPAAAEGQGIDVVAAAHRRHRGGSALMGVAGAFLTLSAFNAFFFNMVNGRGWICVALVVFAGWRPGKALARRVAVRLLRCAAVAPAAGGGGGMPYQVYLMLPYVLSIAALVLVARRATYPQALMKP